MSTPNWDWGGRDNLVLISLVSEAEGQVGPISFDWLINLTFRDACAKVKIVGSNYEYFYTIVSFEIAKCSFLNATEGQFNEQVLKLGALEDSTRALLRNATVTINLNR